MNLQRLAQQELEMKARLEKQRELTLAREQLVQNPQLVIVSFSTRQTFEYFDYLVFSSLWCPMIIINYLNQIQLIHHHTLPYQLNR